MMINGLTVIENFVTIEEEAEILAGIFKSPMRAKRTTKDRNSIQRFGSDAPYRSNMVSKEIPEHLNRINQRLVSDGIIPVLCDSISVNEYFEFQQISAHIDSTSSGKIIVILGLGSPAVMQFTLKRDKIDKTFNQRALFKLEGEARYNWKHAILPLPRGAKRYSIVFRNSKDK